jgi:hypothetical protein
MLLTLAIVAINRRKVVRTTRVEDKPSVPRENVIPKVGIQWYISV